MKPSNPLFVSSVTYYVLLVLVTLTLLSYSFKPKKLKVPPGTVFLTNNLYIDKTEIDNVHWREFTQGWILNIEKDTAKYFRMMQDTAAWGKDLPYAKYYHSHPSFNNYPVVGISYEQAIEFCKWRTDRVNELFQKNPSLNQHPGKRYLYRLPAEVEWESAAAGTLNISFFPFGYLDTVGKKGIWKGSRLFNAQYLIRTKNETSGIPARSAYMSPVNSFLPNELGIYNMIGNISELVAEKGIAKGGNYSLPLIKCKIPDRQSYTKPEPWLGFRCICEVID